ncbi:diguanylate cyclase [Pleurocapsales cyanobacterium LEGE 10410]|nr:diguanylate cyclase [Pleurocapsales cyanobacterium LEGE 10410]
MDTKALKVLLIVDNLTDANWISEILNKHNQRLCLKYVQQTEEAVEILFQEYFDAILLDLSFRDSQEASLNLIKQTAPQLPIIVVTDINDLNMAVRLLRQGVQDYLLKSELEGEILIHSIHHAIDRQRTKFGTRQQALIKKMLDKIRSSLDLENVLKNTVKEIQQFLHTDEALIYLCEPQPSAKKVISQTAIDLPSLDSILSRATSVSAVEDTGKLASVFPVVADQIRSYIILPIWLNQSTDAVDENWISLVRQTATHIPQREPWGILVAYNISETRKWQQYEIDFLQQLLQEVTIAIDQSQLYRQLQIANKKLHQLAISDGLTGIANRRHFDLILNQEWYRLAREKKPLSLILCDIDYFKAYNDSYGHQYGDRCLQEIARILQQSIKRPADLAARYGGEEFALILPNTDTSGALSIAQNTMQRLANKQLPNNKSEVSKYITLSIGIATIIPHSRKLANTIITAADELLYRAKKAGRDRIAVNNWEICC